jgi:hypothetical protein
MPTFFQGLEMGGERDSMVLYLTYLFAYKGGLGRMKRLRYRGKTCWRAELPEGS